MNPEGSDEYPGPTVTRDSDRDSIQIQTATSTVGNDPNGGHLDNVPARLANNQYAALLDTE